MMHAKSLLGSLAHHECSAGICYYFYIIPNFYFPSTSYCGLAVCTVALCTESTESPSVATVTFFQQGALERIQT
jgi:hypothetical protein